MVEEEYAPPAQPDGRKQEEGRNWTASEDEELLNVLANEPRGPWSRSFSIVGERAGEGLENLAEEGTQNHQSERAEHYAGPATGQPASFLSARSAPDVPKQDGQ